MSSAVPEAITDEEEVERLASLQLRDRLLRGLGMFDQIQQLLQKNGPPTPDPTQQSTEANQHNSGVGKSLSHASLPSRIQLPTSSPSLTSKMAEAKSQSFALIHQRSAPPLQK